MSAEYCNSVGAPASLDEKFFQDVLENALLEAYIKIKKISFEMVCAGGDNYCSTIYRVRLSFNRESEALENISVIVKSITVTDSTKFLDDLQFFLKEKILYSHMLPRMEILLDEVKLGPKLYHSQKEPITTLVFEDLSALGYVMADREKGLDLDHCKVVMGKIGQFHAVSMIVHKKEPESMNLFQHGILSEKGVNGSEFYESHFGNVLKGLIELTSTWQGYESITEKVKKYAANLKENLIKSQLPIPGELKVLNHGDLWVNNFLFKYNKDSGHGVNDVVFLDFQISVYGSPAFDINYFLYSSAQADVLKEKRHELLETYHTAMCEILNAYSFKKIPSLADIVTEVRRREYFGFFACAGILPGIAMDKSQSGDNSIEKLMDKDLAKKNREIMFASKRIQDTMRFALKRFDEMGVLD